MKKSVSKLIVIIILVIITVQISQAITFTAPNTCMPPTTAVAAYDKGCDTWIADVFTSISCNSSLSGFATCQVINPGPPQIIFTNCTFISLFSVNPGPPQYLVTAPAQVTMKFTFDHTTGNTDYYQTEMLQMNISGGNLPSGAMIRESPTLQSVGECTIQPDGGNFLISSFFDVFTEISLDGGQTWWPDDNGPRHYEMEPENLSSVPTLSQWGLIAMSLLALGAGIFFINKVSLI